MYLWYAKLKITENLSEKHCYWLNFFRAELSQTAADDRRIAQHIGSLGHITFPGELNKPIRKDGMC